MSLRQTLKYLTLALLIESIIFSLKHPLMLAESSVSAVIGEDAFALMIQGYDTIFVAIQTALYCWFCYHIHILDVQYTDARFGRCFRLEILLSLLSCFVLLVGFGKPFFDMIARAIIELVSVANAYYAGKLLYRYFNTEAMKTAQYAYWIFAARHAIFTIILIVDAVNVYSDNMEISILGIVINWLLLMPILVVGRVYLYKGFLAMSHLTKITIKVNHEQDQAQA